MNRWAVFAILLAVVLGLGCRGGGTSTSFVADIATRDSIPGMPQLKGKLYLSGGRLRLDWGAMADVFDLKQRTGWRVFSDERAYQELGSKDLSTFVPELTKGSMCPAATYPAACQFAGEEVIEGRKANKWDLYNPEKRFHVYYWIDQELGITLRMLIGSAGYEVTNLRPKAVSASMLELPMGYQKIERRKH